MLAETLGAPVLQQTVAWGAHFPSEHPAYLGALNRDQKYVRRVLSDYDLMLCVGSDVLKMSVWSETEPLPETTKVAMIGLRDWEMGKNFPAEIALRADVKETLKALIPLLKKLGGAQLADRPRPRWPRSRRATGVPSARQKAAKVATPTSERRCRPEWVMMRLSDKLPKDAIVVEEGLTSTATLPSYFPFRDRNSFFGNVSGGIGWGIAAAVGVQIAEPKRRVVAVIGDGSAMYSITALWSAANQKLPVIFLITNNEGYQILKNRLKLFHGNDTPIGMDFNDPPMNIAKIAEGFGLAVGARRHGGWLRRRARPGAGPDRWADTDRGDGEEGMSRRSRDVDRQALFRRNAGFPDPRGRGRQRRTSVPAARLAGILGDLGADVRAAG